MKLAIYAENIRVEKPRTFCSGSKRNHQSMYIFLCRTVIPLVWVSERVS